MLLEAMDSEMYEIWVLVYLLFVDAIISLDMS